MRIIGAEKLSNDLAQLSKEIDKRVIDATFAGGLLVEGEAKRSIQTKSAGENVTRYRLGGKAYDHVAAAAGSAPNTDTGNLVRSIRTEVEPVGVFVGTSVEYGFYLEWTHPWLTPALEARKREIAKLIADSVKGSIKAVSKNVS